MRSNQNKNNNNRNRNRNNSRRNTGGGGGGGGPNNKVFDSNGPDIKLRGTTQTVAEKYMQLGRDAQSAGDSVMAENYYQHAEHYYRLWAASQPVGHSLQMSRKLGEEEFDEEGDDQNGADDEGENGHIDAPQGENTGESSGEQSLNPEGQQPRQNRNNNYRDNNNRGSRPRWQNNRNNRNQENRDAPQGEGHAVEPAIDATSAPAQVQTLQTADEGQWEAPSFLQRPTPVAIEESPAAETAAQDAPVPRKPRTRKPRVEADAASDAATDSAE